MTGLIYLLVAIYARHPKHKKNTYQIGESKNEIIERNLERTNPKL